MKPRKRLSRKVGNPLGLKQESSRSLPRSGQTLSKSKTTFLGRVFHRRKFKFTWKKFFITLGIVFGLLVLSATGVFAYYVRELPNPKKITNRTINQSTEIYDRNGKLFYTIHG